MDILKSDIFFFITTFCVVALSVFFIVAIFYVITVLRDIKYISNRIKKEGEEILNDARELRLAIKDKSGGILSFILSLLNMREKRRKRKD